MIRHPLPPRPCSGRNHLLLITLGAVLAIATLSRSTATGTTPQAGASVARQTYASP